MEQCDHQYMAHLKDLFLKYLGNDVVLFTNNACKDSAFECGTLQGMLSTVDGGGGKISIKRSPKQSIFFPFAVIQLVRTKPLSGFSVHFITQSLLRSLWRRGSRTLNAFNFACVGPCFSLP